MTDVQFPPHFLISNINVILIPVFHMTVSQCYVNQHTVSAEDLWDTSICRGKKHPVGL